MFPRSLENSKNSSYTLDKPDSYRPISVLPAVSKILEKAVHQQLMDFLSDEDLLSKFQFGYRPQRSTTQAAILLTDDIRREVDEGNLVGTVFIDLSKAFDSLSHAVLLTKLEAYGIKGNELHWFTDYLFSRQQYVSMGATKSSIEPVFCEVPQGSILGPLLFLVFYNDMADQSQHARVLKYPDDTVIYFPGQEIGIIERALTQDLRALAQYFDENELMINLKKGKTEAMLFGTGKRLSATERNLELRYRGHTINNAVSYKYLGYTLDTRLLLNENFDIAYKRVSNRLRLLSKLREYLTPDAASKIYESMILPILAYNAMIKPVLTDTQLMRLESIERRANEIVGHGKSVSNTDSLIRRKVCQFVRECLDNKVCSNFQGYFEINSHYKGTRNNSILVKLPKVKLEYARKSFRFSGAKIYNDLPKHLRAVEDYKEFKKLLSEHLGRQV